MAGETTAPSRMEQSVDVGGALLQLVLCDSAYVDGRRGCSRVEEQQSSPLAGRAFF